jgi:hypothetical protein
MFCFNAAWTILFSTTYMLWYVDGASHFLANVASSVFWLLATSALWVRPPFIYMVVFQLMNKYQRASQQVLCTTHERERIVHNKRQYPNVDSL